MGLTYYIARESLRAHTESGIASVATLGRLRHYMSAKQALWLDREFGLGGTWTRQRFGEHEQGFFQAAGAREVVAIDASDYEGADVVHNMNDPVPDDLRERFDQVIDGGTIEHVFRPDQALANIMRMMRVGGSAIIWTPANNLCGHGFYQFSPEFFFSTLTPATGFRMISAKVVDAVYPSVSLVPAHRVYEVQSPMEVGGRVNVVSRRPLMMLVHAVKLEHLDDPFADTPQQSDYVTTWAEQADSQRKGRSPSKHLKRYLQRAYLEMRVRPIVGPVAQHAMGMRERRQSSLRNRRFFTPE